MSVILHYLCVIYNAPPCCNNGYCATATEYTGCNVLHKRGIMTHESTGKQSPDMMSCIMNVYSRTRL